MTTLYQRMLEEQAKKNPPKLPPSSEAPDRSASGMVKQMLTAGDLALPGEDAAEISERFEGVRIDLRPRGVLQNYFARRVATMTLRVERSVRQEFAILSEMVRCAEVGFDAARIDEANRLYDWITADPAVNSRKLRETPEGVDRMIRAWQGLKEDLTHPGVVRWDWVHLEKAENLMGRRLNDIPVSRAKALSDAIGGAFKHLEPEEGGDLDILERREWAVDRFAELIDGEIEQLEALMRSFDFDEIARRRAGSADRVLFDASKEALLARKYEAAAERSLNRALTELRRLQAERPESEPGGDDLENLGSCLPGANPHKTLARFSTTAASHQPIPPDESIRKSSSGRRNRPKIVNKR